MAIQVLTNVKNFVGEFDWSGDENAIDLQYSADAVDNTVFGQTTRTNTGGLRRVSLNQQGLFNAGTGLHDPSLFGKIALADVPISVVPSSGTIGDAAYLFKGMQAKYQFGARIGEMLRFSSMATGTGGAGLVRGAVLFNGTTTSSSTSTKVQLGAVSATQSIYAALHVFSVSASDTLDVVLRSDANSSAGGETNRITFTQAGAATSEWKELAGAITDTWWDLSYTAGGSGISIRWALIAGII